MNHSLLDTRSLALHKVVAEKIRQEPGLIEVARSNLERWRRDMGTLPPALQEWQDILDHRSADQIAELLSTAGEEAIRLRQSSPFGGVLSEQERLRILRSHESHAA